MTKQHYSPIPLLRRFHLFYFKSQIKYSNQKKSILKFASLALLFFVLSSKISATNVVVSGATTNATYTTLKGAFDAINAQNQAGKNIIISVVGNTTETATASLTGAGGMWSTLTITPSGARTISGNINAPLIQLMWSDNVTIDGLNSGGNSLTISNTMSDILASAIKFINGANNNTLTNCTISGSNSASDNGVIIFWTSESTTGNNNNTISNNNITTAGVNRPKNVIFSWGTSLKTNTGNIISNNNIYDFLNPGGESNGIYLWENSSDWTITGNSFYETTSFAPTSNVSYRVINIRVGNNHTISNNYIGGTAAKCGGGNWIKTAGALGTSNNYFDAIKLNSATGTASNIQGNTISKINWSNGSFTGILVTGGTVNVGTTTGNIIGGSTGNDLIQHETGVNYAQFTGIEASGATTLDCQNNIIGGITISSTNSQYSNSFVGVKYSGSVSSTISNNTIGSTSTSNSINATSGSTSNIQKVYGIQNSGILIGSIENNTIANMTNGTSSVNGYIHGITIEGTGTNTFAINNNTIRDLNIANLSTYVSPNSLPVVGILNTSTTAIVTISQNKVYNLSNTRTDFGGYLAGIVNSSGANPTVTISRNFVHSILPNSASTVATTIYGIWNYAGKVILTNNIISLKNNSQSTIYGISEASTANADVFFNTVYISGSPTSGNKGSYSIYFNSASGAKVVKNNIFVNKRSNSGATGIHYVIRIASKTNLESNFNNFYNNGNGTYHGIINSKTSSDFPDWVIDISGDANSVSMNPQFEFEVEDTDGLLATDYKSRAASASTDAAGITIDYNGTIRTAPYMMGAFNATIYTITYNSNGGVHDNLGYSNVYGLPYLNPATKADYNFEGWYNNEEFTGNVMTKANTAQNITLYAKYSLTSYIIYYYNTSGSTNTNPTYFTVADLPLNLLPASKTGFSFAGWYNNAAFTGSALTELTTTGTKWIFAKFEISAVIAPTAQATKLLFSTTGTNPYNIVLKYKPSASAEKYLVVRKSTSAPTFVPADGTEYAIGAQGTDQIVYVGTDTTFVDLNKTAGSYFYAIYAYNGSAATTKYLTTAPLVGNTHLSGSNSQTLTASTGQTTAANFPAAGVNINFDNGTTGTSLMVSKTESAPESNFSGLPNVKGVVNMYFSVQSYSPVPGVYTITLDFSSLNLTQAQWAKFKVLKRNDATKAWADVTTLGGTIVNRQTDGVWGKITVSGLSSFSQFSGGLEATTYTVTSALESAATSGTLKNRIAAAEAGDFITFDVTAMGGNKIMLTSPVVVDKNLTIIGAAGGVVLDGGTNVSVIQIGDAVVARLENLIIQNGYDIVAYAGGVWNNGNLTMVNCVVADNESDASEGTGGIVQYSAETDNKTDVLNLINCTVTNNNGTSTFADGVGGLSIYGGTVNVYNTIIYGNQGTVDTDVSEVSTLAKVYNSCIGNLSAITVTTGSGNISSNPKFVGATTNATHPYSLYGNSPCVNTGSNAYSFDSKDIRNQTRIQNTTIDMGAYEWTSGVDNNGTTTAIGTGNEHNVQIYSANKRIGISGAENAQVAVYNQLGQQLFAGKTTNGLINKSFAKGIYIVKVNNEVQKVFVR